MISSIYTSAPIVAGMGHVKWSPGKRDSHKGRYTLRCYSVMADWSPADHGFIPAESRADAERHARLYRTYQIAVQRVSADNERWFAKFL